MRENRQKQGVLVRSVRISVRTKWILACAMSCFEDIANRQGNTVRYLGIEIDDALEISE